MNIYYSVAGYPGSINIMNVFQPKAKAKAISLALLDEIHPFLKSSRVLK